MKSELPSLGRWELTYAQLPSLLHSAVRPTPVRLPSWAVFNEKLAVQLGLEVQEWRSDQGLELLAGNRVLPGIEPIAQAYAGHQFGHFTRLGDGRAILMGERVDPQGQRWDVQWKGSGRTPYSRRGDGRAVLGPMLREYLISEAMAALGVPTTRSLAVVATGEPVFRERALPGAVLTRVAASHLRVGTFEFAAAVGQPDLLRALADYAVQRHDPMLLEFVGGERYLGLLRAVAQRQARLIAQWMLLGFVHGVMNTDNMALSGETIDYGPCAWMERYDPNTVFSSIDHQGRYAYGNQPSIAGWNLARFAESLLPLIDPQESTAIARAQEVLEQFHLQFREHWWEGMLRKLGLQTEGSGDRDLAQRWLGCLHAARADYTNAFAALSWGWELEPGLQQRAEAQAWLLEWNARIAREPRGMEGARALMQRSNPVVIPRNARVEEALAAAQEGELSRFHELLDEVTRPFDSHERPLRYREPTPESAGGYVTYCGT